MQIQHVKLELDQGMRNDAAKSAGPTKKTTKKKTIMAAVHRCSQQLIVSWRDVCWPLAPD